MNSLSFIYKNEFQFFQKKIVFQKNAIDYSNTVYTSYKNDVYKNSVVKSEVHRIIQRSDVIIATSDFDNLSIVTTGGIIIAEDGITEKDSSLAVRKRDARRRKLDTFFSSTDFIYSDAHYKLYAENKDNIKNILTLCKDYLTGEQPATIENYQNLLRCLVEITEPIKSKQGKKLLKEYSVN